MRLGRCEHALDLQRVGEFWNALYVLWFCLYGVQQHFPENFGAYWKDFPSLRNLLDHGNWSVCLRLSIVRLQRRKYPACLSQERPLSGSSAANTLWNGEIVLRLNFNMCNYSRTVTTQEQPLCESCVDASWTECINDIYTRYIRILSPLRFSDTHDMKFMKISRCILGDDFLLATSLSSLTCKRTSPSNWKVCA